MASEQLMQFSAEMRANYRALIPSAGAPDPVAEIRAFTIAAESPTRDIPIRLYSPETDAQAPSLPVVVFIHGGGWVSGDLDTHHVLASAIASRAHALVLSVDYRLSPEHPFPAGLDDTYAVLEWAANHAAEIGGDPARLAIAGDSAGGNLAAAASLLAHDRRGPNISAQWLMYPCVRNVLDTPSGQQRGDTYFPTRPAFELCLACYLPPGGDPLSPLIAPFWGQHEGLPPTLLQAGTLDPLHDEGEAYISKLVSAGVKATWTSYPDAEHGFIQFFNDKATHPAGEPGLEEGIAFLIEQLDIR
ncbi:MAG: alpha/beta hydrolase [Alcanivorax sp.]|uniref:alpha/beta hydrolase n=1 Tax=Alcanivorax sp. TaxID=1872427 RepID=UPI003DA6F9DF